MNLVDEIYNKVDDANGRGKEMLRNHCNVVKEIALEVADVFENKYNIKLDKVLIEQGAMLHDIGLLAVKNEKSITHGEDGYRWMIANGYSEKLASFCLTHVGVGLDKDEIKSLPLDQDLDHMPKSVEEEIVAYADNFTSKGSGKLYWNEVELSDVKMKSLGETQYARWLEWKNKFGIPAGTKAKEIILRYNGVNE